MEVRTESERPCAHGELKGVSGEHAACERPLAGVGGGEWPSGRREGEWEGCHDLWSTRSAWLCQRLLLGVGRA